MKCFHLEQAGTFITNVRGFEPLSGEYGDFMNRQVDLLLVSTFLGSYNREISDIVSRA